MKAIIEVEFSIDGELDSSRYEEIMWKWLGSTDGGVASEEVDGTDLWYLMIDSAQIMEVK